MFIRLLRILSQLFSRLYVSFIFMTFNASIISYPPRYKTILDSLTQQHDDAADKLLSKLQLLSDWLQNAKQQLAASSTPSEDATFSDVITQEAIVQVQSLAGSKVGGKATY